MAFFSNYPPLNSGLLTLIRLIGSKAQCLQTLERTQHSVLMSLGDLDVLFLSPTGIRSLRVRETTLNAYVNDLGSPIDSLVINDFVQGNNAQNAQAIVDPNTGRYWLFVPNTSAANGVGNIYVLSYYPSNKIRLISILYDPRGLME